MGEAITSAVVIGAQKIHDNNTTTNNRDFIFFHYLPRHSIRIKYYYTNSDKGNWKRRN